MFAYRAVGEGHKDGPRRRRGPEKGPDPWDQHGPVVALLKAMSTDAPEVLETSTRRTDESPPTCPSCGARLNPFCSIITSGPTEHEAQPCGCRLSPLLARGLEEASA